MFSELAEAPDIYRVVDCDSPVNLPLLSPPVDEVFRSCQADANKSSNQTFEAQ